MVEDLKKSWIVGIANAKFVAGGQKLLLRYDVPFGLAGIPMSHTLTEQIIGGARISIIPVSGGRFILLIIQWVEIHITSIWIKTFLEIKIK